MDKIVNTMKARSNLVGRYSPCSPVSMFSMMFKSGVSSAINIIWRKQTEDMHNKSAGGGGGEGRGERTDGRCCRCRCRCASIDGRLFRYWDNRARILSSWCVCGEWISQKKDNDVEIPTIGHRGHVHSTVIMAIYQMWQPICRRRSYRINLFLFNRS